MATVEFWLVADRRLTGHQVLFQLTNESPGVLYDYRSSAESAKYPTEDVWKIQITAEKVEKVQNGVKP